MKSIDPALLSRLIQTLAPALTLFARQWCDSPEDVVQEAFIKLIGSHPLPDNPQAWLFRVVRNRAINWARSGTRRGQCEQRLANARPPWFERAPSQMLEAEEAAKALDDLPRELREVIVSRIWGGLSFEQIAELTETTTSTAHRRYITGLERLKMFLDADVSVGANLNIAKRVPNHE